MESSGIRLFMHGAGLISLMKASAAYMREDKWLFLILLLGLAMRLIDITQPFSGLSGWNEAHYSLPALNFRRYGLLAPMNDYGLDLSTSPLLYWAIYVSFKIFGVHEWAARLPSLAAGLISLPLIYLIAKKLYSEEVALLASFIAATAPGIVYFSRSAQLESLMGLFSLAAILTLLCYGDSKDRKWYWASMLCLSLAVLVKYPALVIYPVLILFWLQHISREKSVDSFASILVYLLLPLLPTLIWVYYGFSKTPLFMWGYFSRPQDPWSMGAAIHALSKAVFEFFPGNLGKLQYYVVVAGLPLILLELRKHAPMLLLSSTWLALVARYPATYLNNWYYDYLALYGMAVLAGYGIVVAAGRLSGRLEYQEKKAAYALLLLTLLFFNLSGYNSLFHSYFKKAESEFQSLGEPEPFYSAKYVASVNVAREPVCVDWPSTMFYAGGDPSYVTAIRFDADKLAEGIAERRYRYVVLYYTWSKGIKKALNESGYRGIAPAAWEREDDTLEE